MVFFAGFFLQAPPLEHLIIDENNILANSLFGVTFSSTIVALRGNTVFSAISFSCLALQLSFGFAIFMLQAFGVNIGSIGMVLHVMFLVCTPLAFIQVFVSRTLGTL